MPTETKRPLKKGDKCWVRIQRKGAPVLAVYDGPTWNEKCHWVFVDGNPFIATFLRFLPYSEWEAIFVAKPIPLDAQNAN